MTVRKPETKLFCMWYVCGKQSHIAKVQKSVLPQKGAEKASQDTHKFYSCRNIGHIEIYSPNQNNGVRSENSTVILVMHTTEKTCVKNIYRQCPPVLHSTDRTWQCGNWLLDLGWTKHLSNCHKYFVDFTEKNGSIQVGNKDVIQSKGSWNRKIWFCRKGSHT